MKLMKVSGKKILAGIGILLLLGVTSGCSEAQKFSWEQLKATHYRMITGKVGNADPSKKDNMVSKAEKGQAADAASADAKDRQAPKNAVGTNQVQKQEKVNIVLYFSDQNGDYLRTEKREIAFVPGLAKATVKELIRGPKNKELSRTMPDGTSLLDINIENGLCTVDLSKEFRDNHWGGSSGEILTVYSLVNTLSQFPTVDKVEILVDGQKVETLTGHMDLSVPVTMNSNIVKDI